MSTKNNIQAGPKVNFVPFLPQPQTTAVTLVEDIRDAMLELRMSLNGKWNDNDGKAEEQVIRARKLIIHFLEITDIDSIPEAKNIANVDLDEPDHMAMAKEQKIEDEELTHE